MTEMFGWKGTQNPPALKQDRDLLIPKLVNSHVKLFAPLTWQISGVAKVNNVPPEIQRVYVRQDVFLQVFILLCLFCCNTVDTVEFHISKLVC